MEKNSYNFKVVWKKKSNNFKIVLKKIKILNFYDFYQKNKVRLKQFMTVNSKVISYRLIPFGRLPRDIIEKSYNIWLFKFV